MRRTTLAAVAAALAAGTLAALPLGGRAAGPAGRAAAQTEVPTISPTSATPTITVTAEPTSEPTAEPSPPPTDAPTEPPTDTPTDAPTATPTGTAAPETPTPDATAGTPIVDPSPHVPSATPSPPARIYLPCAMRGHDPNLPGPITTTLEGYVAKLNEAGRQACSPATHVLLARPEGEPGAEPRALLVRAGTDPLLELDLYLGAYVEVSGEGALAAEACRDISWQLIGVRAIRVIEVPPGGP